MRILYFHQHFSTPEGSAGTRSYEMARRLVRDGHSVTVVCGSYKQGTTGLLGPFKRRRREGFVHGIRVIEFDLGYSNSDGFLKRTIIFLKFALKSIVSALREPSDVVFATSTPLTAAIPGIAAKWLRRRPFVFEVRDLWPELPRAMGIVRNRLVLFAMSSLEWLAYRSADQLIGLSPGIVDGIARRGVGRDRIAMIPNGCDLSLFTRKGKGWRPAGVRPTDFMALFTGTHGPANGLDSVVAAAAELKRRGRTDIKIVLVGEGKEKPRLMETARSQSLEDVVIFHPPVPKTLLPGLMESADVGLQVLADVPAFYYGTSPNKFFDYIAAGLPVLTNYPGWIADLLRGNAAGVAVEPNGLADGLEEMVSDRDRLASLSAQSKALAGAFSRDILYDRFRQTIYSASGVTI